MKGTNTVLLVILLGGIYFLPIRAFSAVSGSADSGGTSSANTNTTTTGTGITNTAGTGTNGSTASSTVTTATSPMSGTNADTLIRLEEGTPLPTGVNPLAAGNSLAARPAQDAAVRTSVMDALSAEPAFKAQGLTADVQGGVVKLQGKVASENDKDLAARIAQRVEGIRRVDNEILVDRSLQQSGGTAL